MRYAVGLVTLLVAAAIVLVVFAGHARQTIRTATAPIPSLRESGVDAVPFVRTEALAALDEIDQASGLAEPDRDRLVALRDRAAGWAAGARPGSAEYRCAVKIREAADTLIDPAGDATRAARQARRLVVEAKAALANPTAMPGGVTGAVRDQLENLQQSQKERVEDVERQLK